MAFFKVLDDFSPKKRLMQACTSKPSPVTAVGCHLRLFAVYQTRQQDDDNIYEKSAGRESLMIAMQREEAEEAGRFMSGP